MKRIAIMLIGLFFAITILEACSSRLCPAYSSYPEGKRRRA
jgi:hypothetical protein